MSTGGAFDGMELAKSHEPALATPAVEKEKEYIVEEHTETSSTAHDSDTPSEDDLKTLERVSGKIPWTAYTIAFVELCERFSYYGTTVVFVNFIQQPLPEGSTTGAIVNGDPDGVAGALDMGQRASTGLTTFNAFWSYIMPLLGAYIADTYLGRFNTIMMAIGIALVGHVVLIVSALPPVIAHPSGAIACFSIGLIIMGVGVGCFKSNISPLIAEQYKETKLRVTRDEKKDRRVLMDPNITISRIFLYFYMMINIGALVGQIAMVFAEKYVGFWLAYLLPTIMFLFCPIVLYSCRNKYNRTPPTGSVLAKSMKLWGFAMKGKWSINPVTTVKNFKAPGFWDNVKPSRLESPPAWMTFDDAWVDEVRRGFKACRVFLWLPVYWLAYNQMLNNLTSQAATLERNGVPNDLITNLNPISLVIFIPIVDRFLYPGLRKMGIKFTPIKRMTTGFIMASCSMIAACVTQAYIYRLGQCGTAMNSCEDADGNPIVAPINVWVQTLPYVFIGFSEIFTSVTGLEYAFTKAPKNMRSLVTAVNLFMNAFSSAISQALVSLSEDPLLVWNYGVVAVLAALGGLFFYLTNRDTDKEEDALNMLPDSTWGGNDRRHSVAEP